MSHFKGKIFAWSVYLHTTTYIYLSFAGTW